MLGIQLDCTDDSRTAMRAAAELLHAFPSRVASPGSRAAAASEDDLQAARAAQSRQQGLATVDTVTSATSVTTVTRATRNLIHMSMIVNTKFTCLHV